MYGRSFRGRFSISPKNFTGAGVWVRKGAHRAALLHEAQEAFRALAHLVERALGKVERDGRVFHVGVLVL